MRTRALRVAKEDLDYFRPVFEPDCLRQEVEVMRSNQADSRTRA